MAGLVTDYMEHHGTRFLKQCVPVRVDKVNDGVLHVTWKQTVTGEIISGEFDTVLFAIGKYHRLFCIQQHWKIWCSQSRHSLSRALAKARNVGLRMFYGG